MESNTQNSKAIIGLMSLFKVFNSLPEYKTAEYGPVHFKIVEHRQYSGFNRVSKFGLLFIRTGIQ